MNALGWKFHTNERLFQSSLGSPLELHFGGRIVDFAEYKDITKADVVDHYAALDREYTIVDEAFNIEGLRLRDTVAVYVRAAVE